MEAAQIPWRPIGELFVDRGLVSQGQLEEALAEQAATGKRLGEILVSRNLISSPELTQTLMEQLGREVAKEEGFGSGLWAEIRRRSARSEVADEPALTAALEQPPEEPADPGGIVVELRQDFDGGAAVQTELEELKARLTAREQELAEATALAAQAEHDRQAALTEEREAADRRLASLESRLADEAARHVETQRVLAQALDELSGLRPAPGSGAEDEQGPEDYLCFAPGKEGYRLTACAGRVPATGDVYELGGADHVVTRIGRSPLPVDPRRCVYLQPVS